MNILEAMDDPTLFGPHFKGPTWDAWKAYLAALFALPMSDAQLAAYHRHTGRVEPPIAPFTEATLIKGRRAGGSRTLATVAVFLACFKDYTPYLAPGEMATVAVLAADKKQARTIFRYTAGLIHSVPMLDAMVTDETQETLTLNNRVQIEITAASFRSVRGYTFAAVLADEVAFWRSEESANPDREILDALRPGLASIPGAMLLLASSPYAKRGVLFDAYRRHYGKDGARVLVWKGSTAEMNPLIDPAIIAEAFENDPASAAAEYGGEFRNDIAAFVPREVVDGCTVPGRYELPKIPGCRYFAFVDPSGGSSDSFTLAIAHPDPKDRTVAVLDAVRDVKPPFSPESVVTDFSVLLKAYGIASVTGDRYAGEFPRELFRKQNITYNLSEKPKSDLYRDALPLLNSGKVELLDLKTLTTQLCGLERRTARGGRDSIDHSPGAHDDVANSVAGALLLATTGRAPMNISQAFIDAMSQPDEYMRQRMARRGS